MEVLFNKTTVICGSQNTSKSYTVRNLLERLNLTDDTYDIWIVDPDEDLFYTYPMEYHVYDPSQIDLSSDRMAVIVMDNSYNTLRPELLDMFTQALSLKKRLYIKLFVVQEPQMLNDAILSKVDNMIFSDGHIQRAYMSNVENQKYISKHQLIAPLHIFKALLNTQDTKSARGIAQSTHQPRTIHMVPAIPSHSRFGTRGGSLSSVLVDNNTLNRQS